MGGFLQIIFGLNKNIPFIKEGNQYLKIENENIYWKLSPFQKVKKIAFKNVRRIKIFNDEIFIETIDRIEHYLPIKKIRNQEKWSSS